MDIIQAGSPSHLRALAEFVLDRRGASRLPAIVHTPGRPLELRARALSISARRLRRYLRVTGGDGIWSLGPDGLLPPSLPAIWETAYVLDLLRLGGFPFPRAGIVHLGSERLLVRPGAAAVPIDLHLRLGGLEATRRGTVVGIRSRMLTAAGQLRSESEMRILLRGASIPNVGPRLAEAADPAAAPPEAGWRELARWKLPANLGRRYGLVSGDLNPIHLFRTTARLFGFTSQILQGNCTEAMIAHALIDHVLRGDAGALRRIRIRFTSPLLLPARVSFLVASGASETTGWFRLVGPGSERPYAEGEWAGSAPANQG